eukprot:EG_transcript_22391
MDFDLDFGDPVAGSTGLASADKPVEEVTLDSLDEGQVERMQQLEIKDVAGCSVRHFVLTPTYLMHTSASEIAPQLQKSDILNGTYEGGFKLWNCAIDVIQFCRDQNVIRPEHTVLDAGCGHGLLGIHALRAGARRVHFQDYNAEVLRELTVPNVALNVLGWPPRPEAVPALRDRVAFWAGDWDAFPPTSVSLPWQFDLILCSDVLYTAHSTAKVLRLIRRHLAPNGSAYIGTKAFYFGCGGGALELEQLMAAKPEGLRLERVARLGGSGDLQREVLRLSFI